MKKTGTKIIFGIIIAAALTLAWYMSGSAPSSDEKNINQNTVQKKEKKAEKANKADSKIEAPKQEKAVEQKDKEKDKETETQTPTESGNYTPAENTVLQAETSKPPLSVQHEPDNTVQEHNIPAPVEPEDATITDKEQRCTLSINCLTASASDKLKAEKKNIVPGNGVIFPETEVIFYEGESVFNVLLRETKKNKVHFEFVKTPVYNSAYIEGIANIYEFDCGELSGWLYKVNGVFPNYGCSRYALKAGDKIELVYTCDLGKDVAGYALESGWQKDE